MGVQENRMRVLQLIDSLRPGGAEKMAVNIANALVPHVEESFLCCTRQEGMLKDELKPEVGYLFLNKRSSLDLKALFKLRDYIHKNEIEILHAHSTSYFLGAMLKFSGSGFKLIWHDHYGESEFLEKRNFRILKEFSRLFAGIVSVNTVLKSWAFKNLHCKRVVEIKNFIPEMLFSTSGLNLKGNNEFKIICVANLRPQKDHVTLIKAFEMLDPNLKISLHLVGEDPKTSYSKMILDAIVDSPVSHKIYHYGSQSNIMHLLKQADLGVLPSKSEGLPLALLEYGMARLPVICTRVGQCSEVIGDLGLLIAPDAPEELKNAICKYFCNSHLRVKNSTKFQLKINNEYSEKTVILKILNFYKKLYF